LVWCSEGAQRGRGKGSENNLRVSFTHREKHKQIVREKTESDDEKNPTGVPRQG